jgi:hypothetical protein
VSILKLEAFAEPRQHIAAASETSRLSVFIVVKDQEKIEVKEELFMFVEVREVAQGYIP